MLRGEDRVEHLSLFTMVFAQSGYEAVTEDEFISP